MKTIRCKYEKEQQLNYLKGIFLVSLFSFLKENHDHDSRTKIQCDWLHIRACSSEKRGSGFGLSLFCGSFKKGLPKVAEISFLSAHLSRREPLAMRHFRLRILYLRQHDEWEERDTERWFRCVHRVGLSHATDPHHLSCLEGDALIGPRKSRRAIDAGSRR